MKKIANKYIIVIGLLVACGFVYYIFKSNQISGLVQDSENNIDLNNLASSSLPISTGVALGVMDKNPPPPGYIKYQNDRYSFYFYHSPAAKITEYDMGQGSMIITLENEKKVRGMQIFVVPYWDKTISEDRFKKDVPSGVRENFEPTSLDGVEAVTFNSVDKDLGATREVWAIRGGYLYEVITFQGVGDWFVPIMQTWKFI